MSVSAATVAAAVAADAAAAAAALFSRCFLFFRLFLLTNLANGGFGSRGVGAIHCAEVMPSDSRLEAGTEVTLPESRSAFGKVTSSDSRLEVVETRDSFLRRFSFSFTRLFFSSWSMSN